MNGDRKTKLFIRITSETFNEDKEAERVQPIQFRLTSTKIISIENT